MKPLFEIRVDLLRRCYHLSVTKDSLVLFDVTRRKFDEALDTCKHWILRQGGANKI